MRSKQELLSKQELHIHKQEPQQHSRCRNRMEQELHKLARSNRCCNHRTVWRVDRHHRCRIRYRKPKHIRRMVLQHNRRRNHKEQELRRLVRCRSMEQVLHKQVQHIRCRSMEQELRKLVQHIRHSHGGR